MTIDFINNNITSIVMQELSLLFKFNFILILSFLFGAPL